MRGTETTTLKHAAVAGAICWFLRWVLDEDERRALREFRAAYVMYRAGWFPSTHPRTVEDRERLERADAMLRAREGK